MPINLYPADIPTFYFFGVSTGQSAIQKIYPLWTTALGIQARLIGLNFELNAPPHQYREAVEFIKEDQLSLGGLITTHKLNVLSASRDLFDELDESASLLNEVSCLVKRDGKFIGKALDNRTSRLALEKLLPHNYWDNSEAQLMILGAGGASIATTLGLHQQLKDGESVPCSIVVTARSEERLDEMRKLHSEIGFEIPIEYHVTNTPADADKLVESLAPGSVITNATGMGKDRPGSPLTDAVVFPQSSWAWDMNYRGERHFLNQARGQDSRLNVSVVDGWDYFVYSWTQVVSEVHNIPIPSSGPLFEELSLIASRLAR